MTEGLNTMTRREAREILDSINSCQLVIHGVLISISEHCLSVTPAPSAALRISAEALVLSPSASPRPPAEPETHVVLNTSQRLGCGFSVL